jgi:hypothetical protein
MILNGNREGSDPILNAFRDDNARNAYTLASEAPMNPNRLDSIVDLAAYIFVAALVAFMVFAIYR